ncbi:ATP-binding protein [Deinococcus hopiensis]|uniref:histidine kinase n=1 Tax=Deinococcus hopiensis KR-140 TaxID=695939 RepID=A0A1W1UT73_9DEIO|nr:ATP-binding protein [Deinococcus hopiensis]SMB84325.1 Signal transduction histidine kinase [Deinococcus hopiensis KR-140]
MLPSSPATPHTPGDQHTLRGVPLRTFLLRPLWLPMLLLLLVTLTVAWSVLRNARSADLVHQSQENITLARDLLNDMVDLETGQRGFILTLDPQFLEPYTAARTRLPGHLQALQIQARQAPLEEDRRASQLQQVQRIERLLSDWEERGGGLALRLARTDPEAAVQQVRSGAGKRIMDQIREAIAAYQQAELTHQRQLMQVNANDLRQALGVTVLGVLLTTLTLLVVLRRTATSVAQVLRHLSTTTQGIAHGAVGAPLPPHAIHEVAALAENLSDVGQQVIRRERERDASLTALQESETRHRALISAIPDILMSVNARGEIQTFKPPVDVDNPDWIKAMVGNKVPDVLPPHVAELIMRGVRDSLRDNRPQRAEMTMDMSIVTPEAPAIQDFEVRFVPAQGEEVLIISRDISDRKHVERLKNEFVSTVSHELRTPLTSIRGSLSLIASGIMGELQPRGKKLVEIALNNSERLVRLINDLLDMEKIESGKLEFEMRRLDVNALVRRSVEANRAYAQPFGVELEFSPQVPDVHVWGDEDRLLQVLTNLISNAVKFSPQGSAVTVATAMKDGAVRISVRDRGPGIPPQFRSRIFGRFAQADASVTRDKGGTGLGLSISKAIVDRHGGRIAFEDHPEGGTVFAFELPPSAPEPPFTTNEAAPVGRRLLICEDDRDIAYLLQLILTQAGFESDVSYTAGEARTRLAERPYEALVLDLLLPDHDGVGFIQQLRQQPSTAALPIIVVSAVADERRGLVNGDAVSVVDWINKPLDTQRLLTAVRLASRRAAAQEMHLLHVEDDADLRQVVQEVLRGVATVASAPTLAQARAALRGEAFDLILLDPGLPDGNGLELLPELREVHPHVPVLVFSAGDLDRVDTQRVAATLVKSRTSNEQLLETIRALIHPEGSGGPHD